MRILIVGEDTLCCALADRMVAAALPAWELVGLPIDKRGVSNLRRDISRYEQLARNLNPVFCLADTDGDCIKELLTDWLPASASKRLLLRFAESEAESWVMADRMGFSDAFQVPLNKISSNTDEIVDPKRFLLSLLAKSRRRRLREEMISMTDPAKTGTGYNLHLCEFVRSGWSVERACSCSPSLARSYDRLRAIASNS